MKEPRAFRKFVAAGDENIIRTMDRLFRDWFRGPSWDNWRSVLKAAYALPMSAKEVAFFKTISGGRDPPKKRVREVWCICGRRSGKSAIMSAVAAHAGVFFRADVDRLRPGERASVSCVAVDRAQARVVRDYITSYFDFIPALRSMVTRQTVDNLQLCNDIDISTLPNSFKSVRGRTVLVAVFDEVAFWRSEDTATPDVEVYNAVRPSMMTLPGSMLVAISTAYAKRGLLWQKYKDYFGVDDPDVLVIKAPSLVMNPTLDGAEIQKAIEDDPQAARSEWLGEFRDDISSYVDPETVEACTRDGPRELPHVAGVRYVGFIDPSGGSADSMTLAVSHKEGDRVVVDCVRERRSPFDPESVCVEFAACLRSYNLNTVQSDKYGGIWPVEALARHGIRVEQSARAKSDIYVAFLPLLNARRVELPNERRLLAQTCSLERRTARSGKDSIDHPPGGHDDLINAAAGSAVLALEHQGPVGSVSVELLQRVMNMAPSPFRREAARHGRMRNARNMRLLLGSMAPPSAEPVQIPKQQQPGPLSGWGDVPKKLERAE